MCQTNDESEWTPFYFLNINRFPWIDNDTPTYGTMERCANCDDVRVNLRNPRNFTVVDDRETDVSQESSSTETTETESVSGVDLTDPTSVVEN